MALLDGAVDKAQADIEEDLAEVNTLSAAVINNAKVALESVLDGYTIQISFVKRDKPS